MKTSITYKRVLSLVAMLLLVALPAMAFAAPELTATADKTSVTAGDTVVVTVTLAGKKLSAAEGEFSYDPSLLTSQQDSCRERDRSSQEGTVHRSHR